MDFQMTFACGSARSIDSGYQSDGEADAIRQEPTGRRYKEVNDERLVLGQLGMGPSKTSDSSPVSQDFQFGWAVDLKTHLDASDGHDDVSADGNYDSDSTGFDMDMDEISIDDESSTSEGSSHTASSGSSRADSSFVSPVLNAHQKQLVDKLMTEFKILIRQSLSVRRVPNSGTSSSGNSTSSQSSTQQAPRKAQRRQQPSFVRGGQRRADEQEDGNNHPAEHFSRDPPGATGARRRLACPFWKRDPWKHNVHKSCSGPPGFSKIHRVKEHIYRQHARPIYCIRCGTVFQLETELTAHMLLPQPCEVNPLVEHPDGLTMEQERALKLKRKKPSSTEEEKWRDMFKILFPEDDEIDIPSPYYQDNLGTSEQEELDWYDRFMGREMPRVVRRRLEHEAAGFSEPLENHLRGILVDIVREAQSELSRQFRRRSGGSSISSSSILLQSVGSLHVGEVNRIDTDGVVPSGALLPPAQPFGHVVPIQPPAASEHLLQDPSLDGYGASELPWVPLAAITEQSQVGYPVTPEVIEFARQPISVQQSQSISRSTSLLSRSLVDSGYGSVDSSLALPSVDEQSQESWVTMPIPGGQHPLFRHDSNLTVEQPFTIEIGQQHQVAALSSLTGPLTTKTQAVAETGFDDDAWFTEMMGMGIQR